MYFSVNVSCFSQRHCAVMTLFVMLLVVNTLPLYRCNPASVLQYLINHSWFFLDSLRLKFGLSFYISELLHYAVHTWVHAGNKWPRFLWNSWTRSWTPRCRVVTSHVTSTSSFDMSWLVRLCSCRASRLRGPPTSYITITNTIATVRIRHLSTTARTDWLYRRFSLKLLCQKK